MSTQKKVIRHADKAGTWYTGNGEKLNEELDVWLEEAERTETGTVRAIIGPHAGYSYSGPTAAWAYVNINPEKIKRVFLLGPSHSHSTRKICLSKATHCETPVGDLVVDTAVVESLYATGEFERMSVRTDENEHSLELHMPYIAKIMSGHAFTFVPLMVGHVSVTDQKKYAQILAPFLQDEENLFVVSTDFCHWGDRFGYTPYDESKGELWQSIEHMDRKGMQVIETQDANAFREYLKETRNTICGRMPILILLEMMAHSSLSLRCEFVRYTQSSKAKDPRRDSSVSYASAVVSLV